MKNITKKLLKSFLGENHYTKFISAKNRGFLTTIKYHAKNDKQTLHELGKYHQTDKCDKSHSFAGLSYLDIYERYFHQFKDKNISVLEIGVKDGNSLRLWKSYFRNAQIYGIDIDPRCKSFEEDRIHIEIGSQDNIEFLNNCFDKNKKFDLIIDDGSHINHMTITSFENLFVKRMNAGGIYIIEDLQCSYEKLQTEQNILEIWPGMKYNDPAKSYDNNRETMDMFFLKKIHDLDYQKGEILFVHFWAMICVIQKRLDAEK